MIIFLISFKGLKTTQSNVLVIGVVLFISFSSKDCYGVDYVSTAVPGTYSPAGVPGATDNITITHDWSSYNHPLFDNYQGVLIISATGYLKVAGTFTTWHSSAISIATGGTLRVTGGCAFRAQDVVGYGINSVDNLGTIIVDGDFDNQFCNKCTTCADAGSCASDPDCHWTNTGTVITGGSYAANGLCNAALPVELTFFSVVADGAIDEVTWETVSEVNSDSFEVQVSLDATKFTTIETISAAGFSNTRKKYSTSIIRSNLDRNPTARYYRIKMVDLDGTYQYSVINTTKGNKYEDVLKIQSKGQIVLNVQESACYEIVIYSSIGVVIYSDSICLEENDNYTFRIGYTGFCVVTVSKNKKVQISQRGFLSVF